MFTSKKIGILFSLASATLTTGVAHPAQISALGYAVTSAPTSSSNNNFTFLDPTGGFMGGSNDVSMTWDGTVFTSSSDYTGPGSVSNMSLSSATRFLGYSWVAHDIQVFRPGTYNFDTSVGGGNLETGVQTLIVAPGQLGAHMLWNWNGNNNIDISVVWDANRVFGTTADQQTLTGTALWNSSSIDGDPGVSPGPGIGMAVGGPTQSYQANFSLNGITPVTVPLPASIWLFGAGFAGILRILRRSGNRVAY